MYSEWQTPCWSSIDTHATNRKSYLILLTQSLFGPSPANQKARGLWVRYCEWRTQFNHSGSFIFCKLNDLKSLQKSNATCSCFCRCGCFFGDDSKNVIWKCIVLYIESLCYGIEAEGLKVAGSWKSLSTRRTKIGLTAFPSFTFFGFLSWSQGLFHTCFSTGKRRRICTCSWTPLSSFITADAAWSPGRPICVATVNS